MGALLFLVLWFCIGFMILCEYHFLLYSLIPHQSLLGHIGNDTFFGFLFMGFASFGSGFLIVSFIDDFISIIKKAIDKNTLFKNFVKGLVLFLGVVACFYFSYSYDYINSDGITVKTPSHTYYYSLDEVNNVMLGNYHSGKKGNIYNMEEFFTLKNGKIYRYDLLSLNELKSAIQLTKLIPSTATRVITQSTIDRLNNNLLGRFNYNQNEIETAKKLSSQFPTIKNDYLFQNK